MTIFSWRDINGRERAGRHSVGALTNRRVMLVEDTPDQNRLYAELLRGAGADVTLECSGASAVAEATSASYPFDCIILNLTTSSREGIEAASELRRLGYPGAICGLTANPIANDRAAWMEAGCNAHLTKPVAPQAFIAEVARWTNRSDSMPSARNHLGVTLDRTPG